MTPPPVYINGLGCISPQPTVNTAGFLSEIRCDKVNALRCLEPNYKEYITGDLVRRMSRLIKMGVAAAKIACPTLYPSPSGPGEGYDAIITGTGLGCVEDTEKFLTTLIRNNEELLTPTSFIQSTHNTVSAQIALLLKCHAYNFTYVHRALSFESALLDAMLQTRETPEKQILVGGMDELTQKTLQILTRLGQVKHKSIRNLDLLSDKQRGSIPGEGAAFFLLSGIPSNSTISAITGLKLCFRPDSFAEVCSNMEKMLAELNLQPEDVDLLLTGMNGDPTNDAIHLELISCLPESTGVAAFKPLCGEYFTAVSFGLWMAAQIIMHQTIPKPVIIRNNTGKTIRTILLYNHFRNLEHSFILINQA
jgi:3-oxoacyl-(acyl-carrier-protein) synthase